MNVEILEDFKKLSGVNETVTDYVTHISIKYDHHDDVYYVTPKMGEGYYANQMKQFDSREDAVNAANDLAKEYNVDVKES